MTKRSQRGFTLIELLIVIAVISIIIGITLPRFRGMQIEGNLAKVKAELRTLQTAVESYYIHNGNEYPSDLDDVVGASPEIVGFIPNDPFDPSNDYDYDTEGGSAPQRYVIFSVGPDGDGDADISSGGVFSETNGESCLYVSNISEDMTP